MRKMEMKISAQFKDYFHTDVMHGVANSGRCWIHFKTLWSCNNERAKRHNVQNTRQLNLDRGFHCLHLFVTVPFLLTLICPSKPRSLYLSKDFLFPSSSLQSFLLLVVLYFSSNSLAPSPLDNRSSQKATMSVFTALAHWAVTAFQSPF